MNYIDPLYDWEAYETVYPKPEVPKLDQVGPIVLSPEECERLWNLVIQASKN